MPYEITDTMLPPKMVEALENVRKATAELEQQRRTVAPYDSENKAALHHSNGENKAVLHHSNGLDETSRVSRPFGSKVTRSNSFPPRRKSFDRQIEILDRFYDEDVDEPAHGPHWSTTDNSSGSSNNSKHFSHARQARDREVYGHEIVEENWYHYGGPEDDNNQDGDEDGQDEGSFHLKITTAPSSLGSNVVDAETYNIKEAWRHDSNFTPGERQNLEHELEKEMHPGLHLWRYLGRVVSMKKLSNQGKGRRITIICGGLTSQTYENTLRRYPGTLLSTMVMEESGALFYANREILNAYREGIICEQPPHIAPETWINELLYFRMHLANIPEINTLRKKYGICKIDSPLTGLSTWARHLYLFLEEPNSSWAAWMLSLMSLSSITQDVVLQQSHNMLRCNMQNNMILSMVSLSCISISVICVCIETVPSYQSEEFTANLQIVEYVVITFFSAEFLARWGVAKRKIAFLVTPMSIIDFVSIAPSFIFFFKKDSGDWSGSKVLRILRILRIFKFARRSQGLKVLAETLQASSHELGYLLLALIIFVLIGSSLVFFTEENVPKTKFTSIPDCMWWAIVTFTTVGYGDMAPLTIGGRAVGSLSAALGVVMVAMPISVISAKFNQIFIEQQTGNKVRRRRSDMKRKLTSKLRGMFFSTQGRSWGRRQSIEQMQSQETGAWFSSILRISPRGRLESSAPSAASSTPNRSSGKRSPPPSEGGGNGASPKFSRVPSLTSSGRRTPRFLEDVPSGDDDSATNSRSFTALTDGKAALPSPPKLRSPHTLPPTVI